MKPEQWTLRLENFSKALIALQEVVDKQNLSEIEKDGLIQRFEFTFELAWKTMQDYLYYIGYAGLKGPRNAIKQMARDGFIDQFLWDEMMEARNELTHIYNEAISRKYVDKIIISFYFLLRDFETTMKKSL